MEGIQLATLNKKIYVPASLRQRIVSWYHDYLAHPGNTRMEATINQRLTWPQMQQDIEQHV